MPSLSALHPRKSCEDPYTSMSTREVSSGPSEYIRSTYFGFAVGVKDFLRTIMGDGVVAWKKDGEDALLTRAW